MAKKMEKEDDGLEKEWKKLRGKLKEEDASKKESEEESGLEETVEQAGEAMSSEEFAKFLESSGKVKAPVLERIEQNISRRENLEQDITGFPTTDREQPWETTTTTTTTTTTENEPKYIMGMENPYQASQINVNPQVLTPRDTMPQSEVPRHELLDPMWSMATRVSREGLYPESLGKNRDNKKYYKIVK